MSWFSEGGPATPAVGAGEGAIKESDGAVDRCSVRGARCGELLCVLAHFLRVLAHGARTFTPPLPPPFPPRRSGLSAPSVWRGLSAARRCSSPRSVRVGGVARAAQMRARDPLGELNLCELLLLLARKRKRRARHTLLDTTSLSCVDCGGYSPTPPLVLGRFALYFSFQLTPSAVGARVVVCCLSFIFTNAHTLSAQ